MSHNKTLAAQLYSEFKAFFPENAVEYFVSYYDYYQPEAYVPSSDTFIEKDSSINEEIERLRIATTSSLVSRRDVIVVASVSCIYGLGSPEEFFSMRIVLERGATLNRNKFLERLVDNLYERNDYDLKRGAFRVRGDTVDVMPAYLEQALLRRNPFETIDQSGVGELVAMASERGRAAKPKLKLGVCGEHGGDPESIELFHRVGLDYVSCSPYRVPIARLAAAQAILGSGSSDTR